jgi:predicted ribosome quality control (RQC) complex YloA/Tae2 family protein
MYDRDPSLDDLNLLRLGRHFRLSDTCKVIVGRDEAENNAIESILGERGPFLRVEDHAGPITVIRGEVDDEAVRMAAALCARYSDARLLPEVTVKVWDGDGVSMVLTVPADQSLIDRYKIELKDRSRALQKA